MSQEIIIKPDDQALALGKNPWAAAREAWLNAKEQRTGSPHTRRAYAKALGDWLDFLSELGRQPSQARGVEVEMYRNHLANEGKAPATVAQRLAAVSSFYRYCKDKFTLEDATGKEITLIDYNPIDRAERPKFDPFEGAQKVRPDEIADLLAGVNRDTIQGKRDYSILVTYLFTGRRLIELARLTWGDLTFSKNGSKVSYTYKGKGGKGNTRELPPPAWEAIAAYLTESKRLGQMTPDAPLWIAHRENGRYLPNVAEIGPHRPLSVAMIRRLVNRYTLAALGRKVSPHALRHAAAMLREAAGDDPRTIQKFLDHSSLEMTDRYMSRMRTDKDESWRKVAGLIGLDE